MIRGIGHQLVIDIRANVRAAYFQTQVIPSSVFNSERIGRAIGFAVAAVDRFAARNRIVVAANDPAVVSVGVSGVPDDGKAPIATYLARTEADRVVGPTRVSGEGPRVGGI